MPINAHLFVVLLIEAWEEMREWYARRITKRRRRLSHLRTRTNGPGVIIGPRSTSSHRGLAILNALSRFVNLYSALLPPEFDIGAYVSFN